MIQTVFFCNIYGPLAKPMGEGACEVQNRYLRKKLPAHHVILTYIHALALKKISHKGSVNEKNSCGLKIPHTTPP